MNSNVFNQKVAIVTGAGQGIGFAICRELALQGAAVVLNDIDVELTNKAVKSIQEEGGNCIACSGDSGNYEFIQQMVEKAVARHGKLDIAICNAGITLFDDFLTYSPDSFKKVMDVNLAGTFFFAQAAAKQMVHQGHGGSILFTSSVTGHQAHKQLAAYGMTKAAIEMLAKNLVIELSQYGINVNTVAPGATATERTLNDPGYHEVWSKITPMGRPATPQDIAAAALFLVSDKAKHITGQTLIIDGGWTVICPSPF